MKAFKLLLVSSASALALAGCTVESIADTEFYYNEDSELVFDHSVGFTFDKQILSLQEFDEDAEAATADSFCDESLPDFIEEYGQGLEGSTRVQERTDSFTCFADFNAVSISNDGLSDAFYGINVLEDVDNNEIHVFLDGEEEDVEEDWISVIQESSQEGISVNSEFVFEFPGDVQNSANGQLIAERSYDGSVDRTSIRNDEVESSNIIHITDHEIVDDNGFYVIADNGQAVNWFNILLWSIVGLLSVSVIVLVALFTRGLAKKKNRNAPAVKSLSDPHEITLDNPNPYSDKASNRKRKVSGNLTAAPAPKSYNNEDADVEEDITLDELADTGEDDAEADSTVNPAPTENRIVSRRQAREEASADFFAYRNHSEEVTDDSEDDSDSSGYEMSPDMFLNDKDD